MRTQAFISNKPGFELCHLSEPYVAIIFVKCCSCAILTDRYYLKDELFILAHSFGDFVQSQLAPLLLGCAEELVMAVMAYGEGTHFIVVPKQRHRQIGWSQRQDTL